MSSMTIQLEGFERLDAKLKALGPKVGKKVVRSATRKAAKPILTQTRINALRMVGGEMGEKIYHSLQVRAFKKQRPGSFGVRVQHDPKELSFIHHAKSGKRSYIPNAIEYGHGNARPIPYMRTAMGSKRPYAEKILQDELKKGIEREAKRV